MCYLCMWCIRGVYLVLVRCLCGVCAMGGWCVVILILNFMPEKVSDQ